MWELAFGSWVLLQPEPINACARAVPDIASGRAAARQPTAKRNLLIFPSDYRRECPEQVRVPFRSPEGER